MTKSLSALLLISLLSVQTAWAVNARDIMAMIPPDDKVKPCVRTIETEKITRVVIPLEPFRSVNLVFPFKLNSDNTLYSLSSNRIWTYQPANGQHIVNVFFNSFSQDEDWGKVNDFTISAHGYIFSFTLKAEPGRHCSNYVFNLSEAEKKRIADGEKKQHLESLQAEYQDKFERLDQLAEQKALNLVGLLSSQEPKSTGIHEEASKTLVNGDDLELFVDEIHRWGQFNLLKFELKNGSSIKPLYIKSITAYHLNDHNRRSKPIPGAVDYSKKMDLNSSQVLAYSTLQALPETGGVLVVSTDQGDIEVEW